MILTCGVVVAVATNEEAERRVSRQPQSKKEKGKGGLLDNEVEEEGDNVEYEDDDNVD